MGRAHRAMNQMYGARIHGHTLIAEGAAFELSDKYGSGRRVYRVRAGGAGGTGFGCCSCGAQSEVLDSGGKRKAWHRAHKMEVAATAVTGDES